MQDSEEHYRTLRQTAHKMLNMTGAQTHGRHKPKHQNPFTSGYNEDNIQKKLALKEKPNFISKPFIPTEFLRLVRATLDS